MDPQTSSDAQRARALLTDFSLEMTAKDTEQITEAAPFIPAGTRVNVTFLGNEEPAMRVRAAATIRDLGLLPVPHIAARRMRSAQELEQVLRELQAVGASDRLCVIGGDPSTPAGPFDSSLSVIRSGALVSHGVQQVELAGYPGGHPDISTPTLWEHLELKLEALEEQGIESSIVTQFSFDTTAIVRWIEAVRERGITAPIKVGAAGPVSVKRLLGFARRFGISSNAMIVRKYGFSLTNLVGTAGPDRFVTDLATQLDRQPDAGQVDLHFYTFGGVVAAAQWIHDFTAAPDGSHDAAVTN